MCVLIFAKPSWVSAVPGVGRPDGVLSILLGAHHSDTDRDDDGAAQDAGDDDSDVWPACSWCSATASRAAWRGLDR
jgi:hypothetical protein